MENNRKAAIALCKEILKKSELGPEADEELELTSGSEDWWNMRVQTPNSFCSLNADLFNIINLHCSWFIFNIKSKTAVLAWVINLCM